MAYTDQDLVKGIDLPSSGSVTDSQLEQLVDSATPSSGRGLVLYQDETPDVATYPKLVRYLWIGLTDKKVKKYNGSTWVEIQAAPADNSVATVSIQNDAVTEDKVADGAVTSAKLANDSVTEAKTAFDSSTLPIFDSHQKRPFVDPRAYGADNTGVSGSTAAIRKAIYAASLIGGVVKFAPGTYLLDINTSYDALTESTPFGYGGSLCYRDKYSPLIPILDDITLVADGSVTLKLAVTSNGPNRIFSSLGRTGVVIDGLIIDGNLANQPNRGSVYGEYGGLGDNAIMVGNSSIVKNCTIKNFVGCNINAVDAVTVSPYYPQISLSRAEPFAIICGSDCQIIDNVIQNHWSGGISPSGRNSIIARNRLSDIAGNAIATFIYQADNAGYTNGSPAGALPPEQIIFHYMMRKYASYKGVDIGTVDGLNSGDFYGLGEDDTTMEGHFSGSNVSNNYNESVYAYYAVDNIIENNIIERCGNVHINFEHSLRQIARNNTIIQGIPLLTYPALTFPVTNGTILQTTGAIGINSPVHSGDTIIENNTFIVLSGDSGKIPLSSSQKAEFSIVNAQGFSWPIGKYLDTAASYVQPFLMQYIIRGNKVLNKEDNNDLTTKTRILSVNGDTGKWASNYPIQLSSTSPDDSGSVTNASSFQANVTEFCLENPFCDYPLSLPVAAALFGSFNILNTQGNADQLSYEYFAMVPSGGTIGLSGVYQGTKQRNHRFFMLRKDVSYKLTYDVSVTKRDDATFIAKMTGEIYFSYSSSGVTQFKHNVIDADLRNGFFEFVGVHDQLLVNNIMTRQLQNRVLPAIYRGGIRVYFNPIDYTLYGYTGDAGSYNINQQLIFVTNGKIEIL